MTEIQNQLEQGIAWYKPTEKVILPVYEEIAQQADEPEQHQDRLQALFEPDRYTPEYLKHDLEIDRLANVANTEGAIKSSAYGFEHTDNGYFIMQHEFYNTLRALQHMFRLGVEKKAITKDTGEIKSNQIDKDLAANISLKWHLASKYGEDSHIGMSNTETGDAVTVTLRDTRSSQQHGKNMLKALTDSSRSNFLVRQAVKSNLKDKAKDRFTMAFNGAIKKNDGNWYIQGLRLAEIKLVDPDPYEFSEYNPDFEPPSEDFWQ